LRPFAPSRTITAPAGERSCCAGQKPLSTAGSVSPWIAQFQAGDHAGAQHLFLGDEELQRVALGKLEGYDIEEIAAPLGLVPRTVQRRLQLIRRLWEQELSP
jgi:hypothetical protein